MARMVRIGCGSGFWGDSPEGPKQLVARANIDYLVLDYLAEITMSILAGAKAKDPAMGYAVDFVTLVMSELGPEIARKGIKVVTNAGGVNPLACRVALNKVLRRAGADLKVAVVVGDDLTSSADQLRDKLVADAPFPEKPSSVNAYLGAPGIAAALDAGADVVVTGRCADSALALGPLIHEFGWSLNDYDRLAAGSLAGHIIECGTQATGGLFTDWREVAGWEDMGFPIAACREDGSFDITKPAGTGGLLTPRTVGEQIVYEIGDPRAYLLPDVVCDFSNVRLTQNGADCVTVEGARGLPSTPYYKLCTTYEDGYRSTATMMIGGIDAAAKARRVAGAILERTRRIFGERGYADYGEVSVEVLGVEDTYGPHARVELPREVILKLAVRHQDRQALGIFAREIYPSATSMSPGITGFAGGRPGVSPVIRLHTSLVPKELVTVTVDSEERRMTLPLPSLRPAGVAQGVRPSAEPPVDDVVQSTPAGAREIPPAQQADYVRVPLIALAHGRSGDKGDISNVGILARDARFLPVLREHLTAEGVGEYFAHLVEGPVQRFEWPGLQGFNFLMHRALGGGGVASLRYDPQGKAYAQMLLEYPVPVPAAWVAAGGPLAHLQP